MVTTKRVDAAPPGLEDAEEVDFVVECQDGMGGSVRVKRSDTLADVRSLVLVEFDDDMLPAPESKEEKLDFVFQVNGKIRLGVNQEKKRRVAEFMDEEGNMTKTVSLHPRKKPKTSVVEEPVKALVADVPGEQPAKAVQVK